MVVDSTTNKDKMKCLLQYQDLLIVAGAHRCTYCQQSRTGRSSGRVCAVLRLMLMSIGPCLNLNREIV